MTVSAHSHLWMVSNKLVNEAANDSARVSGQDRKIPPALGTNQIAGFGGFRPLASLEKNKSSYGCTPEVWTAQEKRKSCSRRSLGQLASWVLFWLPECILTAKGMNQFFDNIADKNACFFDWMQILTQRVAQKTEKQALILARYKHATIDRLAWVNIRFLEMRVKFCLFVL